MKRIGALGILLAAMSGCVTANSEHEAAEGCGCHSGEAATVPGVQGPWGQPVTISRSGAAMPASASSGVVQAGGVMQAGGSGVMQAGGVVQAGGACPDGKCIVQAGYHGGPAPIPVGPSAPPGVVA